MICPICNKEHQPTDAFCPTCGYEIHILPGNLSDAVRKYEETREKNYREIWKALYDSKTASQRAETLNKEIQHALDNKQEELAKTTIQNKDLANQLSQAHYEISQLHSQIKEKQEDKGTIQKLKEQISDYLDQRALLNKEKEEWKFKSNEWESKYNGLFADMSEAQRKIIQIQSQLQSTTKEKEEWKSKSKEWESKYNSLFADMSEAQHKIDQIQSQLKSVTEEKERLEDALSKKNNSQTNNTNSTNLHTSSPQNRGERKGEVLFTDGQHEFRQDIFSGENVYSTPNNMISGYKVNLFKITMGTHACVLNDLCGGVRDDRNREIKKDGKQIFNNEILFINSIKVQVIINKKR